MTIQYPREFVHVVVIGQYADRRRYFSRHDIDSCTAKLFILYY